MGERAVMTGFTTMGNMMGVLLKSGLKKYPLSQFTAAANRKDLEQLASFVAEGKVKPFIEKEYHYKEIPQAVASLEAMRTRGKVVMLWS